jgi:hypothetical protein
MPVGSFGAAGLGPPHVDDGEGEVAVARVEQFDGARRADCSEALDHGMRRRVGGDRAGDEVLRGVPRKRHRLRRRLDPDAVDGALAHSLEGSSARHASLPLPVCARLTDAAVTVHDASLWFGRWGAIRCRRPAARWAVAVFEGRPTPPLISRFSP